MISSVLFSKSPRRIVAPPALVKSFLMSENIGEIMKLEDFNPEIPSERIEDLRARLEFQKNDPLTAEWEGERERFGFTHARFKQLRTSWIDFLDPANGAEHDTWGCHQAYLKTFSHYKAQIEDCSIHFIRESPTSSDKVGRKVIPLLLLGGWPSSITEFLPVIKPLAHPSSRAPAHIPAFDIVVASQPGYVFSGKVESMKAGSRAIHSGPEGDLTIPDVARIHHKLMLGLGFSKYAIQGGDWASGVVRRMAVQYPNHVAAVHLNFCPAPPPRLSLPLLVSLLLRPIIFFLGLIGFRSIITWIEEIPRNIPRAWLIEGPSNFLSWVVWKLLHFFINWPSPLDERERMGVARGLKFQTEGSAYAAFHGTRPATLGLVLSSSPLALLAWIAEKFYAWTDEDPHDSEILTSLTLWWTTDTLPSSLYPYRNRPPTGIQKISGEKENYIKVPTGYSDLPFEIIPTPKSWVKSTCNLKWYRQHQTGGHFFALERPDRFVEDMQDCFRELWKG